MTTVAYRSGVMAADSRGYSGDKVPIGSKTKIARTADGTLVGCSSTRPGQPEAFLAWVLSGADARLTPDISLDVTCLVVRPDGSALLYASSWLPAGPFTAPFFAIGSGENYALGAMAVGATAEQAVSAAISLDVWSDGPVTVLRS